MSVEILTLNPEFGLKEGVRYNTTIFQSDNGKEKRHSNWEDGIRSLDLSLQYESETNIDILWNFFKSRKGRYDTFWIKFPTPENSEVIDEAVGTGDNSQTIFNLDYFPINTSSIKVYLDGVLQTSGYTVENDLTNETAKITFTTAPGQDVEITADYDYYIQVRFMDDYHEREYLAYKLYNASVKLIEVLWDTYQAP